MWISAPAMGVWAFGTAIKGVTKVTDGGVIGK